MSIELTKRSEEHGQLERYEQVASIFRPLFARIKEGAVGRENSRVLLHEEITQLKNAGIGALRIPREYGGYGLTIPQLSELLTELSQADSNIPQSLRAHFAFVEMVLHADDSVWRNEWLTLLANGDIVGNAWTEIGAAKSGELETKLVKAEDGFQISGTKYYSTGTIYADWILVLADDANGEKIFAVAPARHSTVTIIDDWHGFGQKLTGSGTTVFTRTPIKSEHVLDKSYEPQYLAAFFQFVHLATLSGIARAATNDAVTSLQERSRSFTHAAAPNPREDPQLLQIIGNIESRTFAIGAIVDKAVASLSKATFVRKENNEAVWKAVNDQAELDVSKAQSLVSSLTIQVTSTLFDALGASATAQSKSFDRYFRNARTVATHNPVVYKERIVGDYLVNQTPPPYVWYIGQK